MIKLYNNCVNCIYYEKEWEYCFRLGTHVPKIGCCGNYHDGLSREK